MRFSGKKMAGEDDGKGCEPKRVMPGNHRERRHGIWSF